MSQRKNAEKLDAFNMEADIEDVADAIYGKSEPALNTGRQVAKAISIYEIYPDLRQPRRAIPMIVRGSWGGDPDELPDVFALWQLAAEKEAGETIDIAAVLKNRKALNVEDASKAVFAGFAKLCSLAAAIYSEGLTNPITIVRYGVNWQIETGERRWLAHHLLALHIDKEKYGRIAAREVEYDPFRQASENNARDGYNAIEMARQIALLIMEARNGLDGVKYDKFEDLVLPGECDRKFYAQVANGYIHKIPDGLGDKISNATGMSLKRLSHYRSLLKMTDDEELNDKLWIEADTNDWTENYISQTVLPQYKPKVESSRGLELSEDGNTPNNADSGVQNRFNRDGFGKGVNPPAPSPFGSGKTIPPPSPSRYEAGKAAREHDAAEVLADDEAILHKTVRIANGETGKVIETRGKKLLIEKWNGKVVEVYRTAVMGIIWNDVSAAQSDSTPTPTPQAPQQDPPPSLPPNSGGGTEAKFPIGAKVIVRLGKVEHKGEVRYFKGGRYGVFLFKSGSTHYYDDWQISFDTDEASSSPAQKKTGLVVDEEWAAIFGKLQSAAFVMEDMAAANSFDVLKQLRYEQIMPDADVQAKLQKHFDAIGQFCERVMKRTEEVLGVWADESRIE